MSKKPTVLMILDGYGLRDEKKGNGIAEANTPGILHLKSYFLSDACFWQQATF